MRCLGPSDNSILYMMVLLRELLPALPKVLRSCIYKSSYFEADPSFFFQILS